MIIAPDADEDAKQILASKKNLRLLIAGGLPDPLAPTLTYRSVAGGFLVQTRDNGRVTREKLKVVTKRQPSAQEITDMLFAFTIGKHVKSNAIIYVKDGSTAGIGAGQMSRVDSARIAAIKAKDAAKVAGWAAAPHHRLIGGVGSLLPLPRRIAGGCRSRRHGGDPAGRFDERSESDRRGRRSGAGDGFHRHAPFPALTRLFKISPGSTPQMLDLAIQPSMPDRRGRGTHLASQAFRAQEPHRDRQGPPAWNPARRSCGCPPGPLPTTSAVRLSDRSWPLIQPTVPSGAVTRRQTSKLAFSRNG